MSRLRLDLIVRSYPASLDGKEVVHASSSGKMLDRWTWRLWSGSRIVSTSGSQLYSRRIDCIRGAEVGAGLTDVAWALNYNLPAVRWDAEGSQDVTVRILDERATDA